MDNLPDGFDGPRLVRREELIASIRLSRMCFGGPEIENEKQVLASYVPPRRGGTYVLVAGGEPISQIGIFHDRIKIYDGMIRAGSIGGVCTHPNYRRQGLASLLLEHCTRQLVKEGARLMLISGDEGVYMRAGNVFHGKYMYFSIIRGQGSPWRHMPADLVLRRATAADALLCSQLYQAEPVHFVRRKSDFLAALQDPKRNTFVHADQWIIERRGQPVAYLFLGVPWVLRDGVGPGFRHVSEYAGSRAALVDAIATLMTTGKIEDLSWPAVWQDAELIQLLEDSGYQGTMAPLDGHTLRIINFAGLMKDLRPVLRAGLDSNVLRGLRFEQSGPLLGGRGQDRYSISRGSDRLELNGAAMTRLVLGNADPQAEAIQVPGALAEVISALFPLPSFLPGLNYH